MSQLHTPCPFWIHWIKALLPGETIWLYEETDVGPLSYLSHSHGGNHMAIYGSNDEDGVGPQSHPTSCFVFSTLQSL